MPRPHRGDFAREGDWLLAAMVWLDRKWPGAANGAKRAAKWRQIDPEARTARIAELIEIDPLTRAQSAEFDALIDEHVKERRRDRAARNERNNT